MIKEEINLPIYRAKRVDNGEYVEGCGVDGNLLIQCTHFASYYREHIASVVEIDTTTIAVHYPDMLVWNSDRLIMSNLNKDLRLFASIRNDGKGGDIVRMESECEDYVAEFNTKGLAFYEYLDCKKYKISSYYKVFSISEIKIIGIME